MIRVLLVSHSLTTGGAERFAANLAAALDRSRFAPELCLAGAAGGAGDRDPYPLPAAVPRYELGYRRLADLPRTVARLRRRLAADRPDVVLSNVLSTNCLTGTALAGLRRRPPWVARAGLAPGGDRWWQAAWARRVYPGAAALVGNSESLAGALARAHPRLAGRVRALPNPTDFAALDRRAAEAPAAEPERGRRTLLAVGRLSRQKRPDLVLAALARVRRRVDARLWWCGEGPLAGEARRTADALGLADAVDWLGFCDNPFALMRRADLLISASDFEGLPNALIEAQGLGLPAVATDCPHGPAEVIGDGVTGRLVPPGDAVALAAAALELLTDEGRRRAMGEAAVARARGLYDASRVVPRWQALLTEVAAGGASGRE